MMKPCKRAPSTDKQLEEGGIARGKELLVLESSVQHAARCQHLQTSQALNPKNPPPQNCRAHDALRATSWGDPSSPVPEPLKRPTPPLPPSSQAVDSLMVMLPPKTCKSISA